MEIYGMCVTGPSFCAVNVTIQINVLHIISYRINQLSMRMQFLHKYPISEHGIYIQFGQLCKY